MSEVSDTSCDPAYIKPKIGDRTLTVFNVNMQPTRNKYKLLIDLLERFTFSFDITVLTETCFTNDSNAIKLPAYNSFYHYHSERTGGVVFIAVHNVLLCDLILYNMRF